ncbi:MAG TPA: Yip1 family protein [Casimicrobiaceae bacterium]|nr:Yip1 family protein [Casimicrobiaceae bacterium]
MNVVDRIKGILLDPRAEWPRIATEPATVQSLYTGWIMLLAAIGPIMILLSTTLFTSALGFGFGFGVRAAIAAYINALIGVAVLAMIVDVLAPSFGGAKDYVRSLKLVAYSFTSVWVAQIALIVPVLGWLIVLAGAIYGFYLFFLGAPLLGRCSVEKAVPYTIVVVLCAIVLSIIIQRILFALIGLGTAMPGSVGLLR